MLRRVKIDKFVIAIAVSIVLAYFFPQLGASDSPVPMDLVSSLGISLIFFFYGLSLSTETIKNGLHNWKLHLTVQSCTFLLFPLLILPFFPLAQDTSYEIIWMGFLFLAALPSTVSSSVVMVSLAKGNLPAAIFNASISGIIGIVMTPFWMMLFLQKTDVPLDFTAIYMQLLTEIVVPLALGLLLRRFFAHWAHRYKKQLDLFDKFVILLIIYKSFVHSFEERIFSSLNVWDFLIVVGLVLLLFFVVFNLTGWIGKKLGFDHADQITNQFCGTKKSLVHGTVFSKALFAGSGLIGILLLPLMIYHALQILIISVIATKIGKEKSEETSAGTKANVRA